MARPTNKARALAKIRDIFTQVADAIFWGGKGRPTVTAERINRSNGGESRIAMERPFRDMNTFLYIQEILSVCPAVEYGINKLAQDAAVDENGDDRGWSLIVRVDTDEDASDEERIAAYDLQRELTNVGNALISRTGIGNSTESYIYKMLTAGNCFAEMDISLDPVTGFGRIEGVRELPTWQMYKTLDDHGNTTSYYQRTEASKDPIVWAIPGQILHWKMNGCDYLPYGMSELLPLKNRFEQFKLLEYDLFVAIHTRAVAPVVHEIGRDSAFHDVSDDEVREYKNSLQENPGDINRFYVVKKGQTNIKVLDGDAVAVRALLEAHRDIEARMLASLGIPLAIAGSTTDTSNRHQAAIQQADYARRISSIRRVFSTELGRMVKLEYALNGYDLNDPTKYGVRSINIEFRWPELGESRIQRSSRLVDEFTAGVRSLESVLYELGEQDPAAIMAQMMAERDKGIAPLKGSAPPTPNGDQGKGVQAGPDAQPNPDVPNPDTNKSGDAPKNG